MGTPAQTAARSQAKIGTQDIEGVIVHAPQGARSLTVFLIGPPGNATAVQNTGRKGP
jgi:hypothetical protein